MIIQLGQVVAIQGKLGKKDTNGDLNRATQLLKQTGSSFKPLACVAPAINEGIITAATTYTDKKVTYGTWSPKNYYSGYKGLMTVRHAIEISCNTVQVQIMNELGVSTSIEYLRKMGFTTISDNEGLALALGGLTNGVSPLEMAAAYACIANDGLYIEPTFYIKVLDSDDNEFLVPNQTKTQVITEAAAYVVKSILTEPVYGTNSATATYCKITGIETAAKTGTTNDDYDRWLCGFTPYYTAAVWYGYDKNETVHYSGSPSNPAGAIWSAVMKSCHADLKNKKFTKPDGVVTATVCKKTGLKPKSGCSTVTDYFVKGTVPTKSCTGHSSDTKTLTICSDSGLIATDACPNTEKVTYDKDDENIPTKKCTKHKASSSGGSDDKDNTTNTNTNTNNNTSPSTNNEADTTPTDPPVEEPDPDGNETSGT